MEIPVICTNTNMDLYSSKLSNCFDLCWPKERLDFLNKIYNEQHDIVKCLNLMKDELSRLNLPKELDPNGCDEEVEINDKLLELIKSFKSQLIIRIVAEYIIFSYSKSAWLRCLDMSNNDAVNQLRSVCLLIVEDASILKSSLFVPFRRIFSLLFCGSDLHVGPYRVSKQDMLIFSDFVYKFSQCTSDRLGSITKELHHSSLQAPSLHQQRMIQNIKASFDAGNFL